ncbi:MAG: methyltransferase domain-containing protein [Alphaproteobacteria bacterium]|nr:methyltransferase domain-containing protein [Alphaproteobacteria bacterium]
MTEHSTRLDARFGHRVLDPMPTQEELEAFYRDTYYTLIDEGRRAADIARSRRGGEEADDQARWLSETLHRDITDAIQEHGNGGKRVLEVGCGLGGLLADLADRGFEPLGVDLATAAVEAVRERGFTAHAGAFDELVSAGTIVPGSVDAVLFVNVLEQTFDPAANLAAAAKALAPGGVVIVRSGNDFNPLQTAAVDALGMPRWWISAPEHIHYLSYDAVEAMMRSVGLSPRYRQSDFPMELFLLLGSDYITDKSLGGDCHHRRVAFERALPVATRRRLYQAFAQAGMGRCLFVVAAKTGDG